LGKRLVERCILYWNCGNWDVFVSLQYLAKAGWSSVVKRVPEAFPKFLYISLPILLAVFFFKGDVIFHWMHHGVTEVGSENYDKIIAGKAGYLNKTFFMIRLVGLELYGSFYGTCYVKID